MERLRDTCNETTHLVILDGADVVYIEKLESSHPVRIDSQVGGRTPAFCVAHGKVLLAHHPELAERILAGKLPRFTSRTLTDPEVLRRDMARTRRQGYAMNNQEWREGVCGIAAPIWDRTGTVVAALSLSMPATRFTKVRLDTMLPVLKEIAREVSRALGFPGPAAAGPPPTNGRGARSRTRGGDRHGANPTT
jgi:DNA-binding IclR family transcriptional regulator